ncbi:MAG TPA: agmatine deiminase family protein [Bacteroidales bacterium]|nr:agmatine deiminase family protein [Bacteroidales bacterium]
MRRISVLLALLVIPLFLFSQQPIQSSFEGSHHMLSHEELLPYNGSKVFEETDPPVGNVRSIAEFEKNSGVIVSRPAWGGFGIPLELIASLSQQVIVYVIVANASANSSVLNSLDDAGCHMENITIININIDSYWSRDYSPWFIAYGDSFQIGIVDFPYNRPQRVNDDQFPVEIADYLGLPVFGMNLTHTGGNYMCDGMGVAASTKLVESENDDLSTAEINQLASDYLGIEHYHLIQDPLGEYIEHVDCWGKFLDVDKILISQVAEADDRYDDFESVANYWANQTTSYGNKYQVFRVYSPNGQPYTNSLIMNDKVYVALVTGTGSEWNDEALDVYENAMPGYEVIGMYNTTSSPWETTDALHCRTHEVPDFGMLYISHMPYYDTIDYSGSFTFSTEIQPYSGEQVVSESVKLHYKINNGSFVELAMQQALDNVWTCSVNSFDPGDVVDYYLSASDESGRSATHPFIGSSDPHHFVIAEDSYSKTFLSSEFTVYPNPVRDRLTVIVEGNMDGKLQYKIVDVYGKTMDYGELSISSEWQRSIINTDRLAPGVYMLVLENEGNVTSKRFIVY